MPILSRWAPVNTDTATGTFCRLCSRFWATTTISLTPVAASPVVAPEAWSVAAKAALEQNAKTLAAPDNSNNLLVKIPSPSGRRGGRTLLCDLASGLMRGPNGVGGISNTDDQVN